MNFKGILLALISVLMLSGCALIKSNNNKDINVINPTGEAKYEAFGAERMEVLGMVATNVETRCSAVEFFKYTTKVYPNADDMINVRMEETEVKKGSATSYSCKYSGLAVSYTPLSIKEAQQWSTPNKTKQSSKTTDVLVVDKQVSPAPACNPCGCVTCGCQPCNNINPNNF